MVALVDLWRRFASRPARVRTLGLGAVVVLGAFSMAANVGMAITPTQVWNTTQAQRYVSLQKSISDVTGHPLASDVVRGRTLDDRFRGNGVVSVWVRRRSIDPSAPQERTGEHDRHHALEGPCQYQRQPQSPQRRHTSSDECSYGCCAPHQAAPGATDSSHEVGGSQPLAERDGDDRDDGDSDADQCRGGSGHDPRVRRGHDQIADT